MRPASETGEERVIQEVVLNRIRYALLVVPVLVGVALPSPAAAQAPYDLPAASECEVFRNTFGNAGKLALCKAVAALAVANPQSSPLTLCSEAGFSGRRRRGQRRSDLAACKLAVERTVARVLADGA